MSSNEATLVRAPEDSARAIWEREEASKSGFRKQIFARGGLRFAIDFLEGCRKRRPSIASCATACGDYSERMRAYDHVVGELTRAIDDWADDPPCGDARERSLHTIAHLDSVAFGAAATLKSPESR